MRAPIVPRRLAAALGIAVAAWGARAAAFSCGPLRELEPLWGATVGSDAQILDICYYYTVQGKPRADGGCSVPVLQDAAGQQIELIEERRISSTEIAHVITTYRPASELAPGTYRLFGDTESSMREFSVEEGVTEPPALPVLREIEDLVRSPAGLFAPVIFEPFEGTLVVDRDGRTEDPLAAVDVSFGAWPGYAKGIREFDLARGTCQVNFPTLDYGFSTTLRFGVLNAAGSFSGWTEPVQITLPSLEEVDAREAAAAEAATHWSLPPQPESTSACGLALPGIVSASSSGLLAPAALCLAGAWRRRQQRARTSG